MAKKDRYDLDELGDNFPVISHYVLEKEEFLRRVRMIATASLTEKNKPMMDYLMVADKKILSKH